jgi:serine/threonine-protein kinase
MDRLGLSVDTTEDVVLDVNQPWGKDGKSHGIYRDGPLVSQLDESMGDLPQGTLVYGYLWTGGKRIVGHYDRVKLPTGETLPVCFALGFEATDNGIPNVYPSPGPGAVTLPQVVSIVRVYRFEGE